MKVSKSLNRYLLWVAFIIAYFCFAILHESIHLFTALIFSEFDTFVIHPYGFEVLFNTAPDQRNGFHWLIISGGSNIATILTGYILYKYKVYIIGVKNKFIKSVLYYLTILLLLADPINIVLGPLIYGGDAIGMARGLKIDTIYIQITGVMLLIINRELMARFIQQFGIQKVHQLFKPWI